MKKKVLITGGAGYKGSVLVPKLLNLGYQVTVIDLMVYGQDTLSKHPNLKVVQGDINDYPLVTKLVQGQDAVIHLAFISDNSNLEQLRGIKKITNQDAAFFVADAAKQAGVKQFIFASSTSVYGKQTGVVTEETQPNPLTDYARFKLSCEEYFFNLNDEDFAVTCIRPSTVCGYSPRSRFDLIVNFMTGHATLNRKIPVLGRHNVRPSVHIEDITDLYTLLLEAPRVQIAGQVFNVGFEKLTVEQIAEKINSLVGDDVELAYDSNNDKRSYNISTERLRNVLQFSAKYTIADAVKVIVDRIEGNEFENPLTNELYFNRPKTYSI